MDIGSEKSKMQNCMVAQATFFVRNTGKLNENFSKWVEGTGIECISLNKLLHRFDFENFKVIFKRQNSLKHPSLKIEKGWKEMNLPCVKSER